MALNDYTRRLAQMASTPRAVRRLPRKVAFLHIPKTAGSSIHAHFRDLVGGPGSGQFVMIDDHSSAARVRLAGGARYVGGHFGALQLARLPDKAYTFTFLRHPLDRLISAWRFATTTAAGAALTRYPDFETALASEDPILHEGFDNVIARQLAAAYAPEIAHTIPRDEWVDRALDTLKRMHHVGTLERIDEDFAIITSRLGLQAPAGLKRQNVTDDPSRKGWQGKTGPQSVEKSDRLLHLAAPWIALDEEVTEAWQQQQAIAPSKAPHAGHPKKSR